VVTPDQAQFRSGHISIVHPEESFRINEALKARGVIPDFRPPDIIRIAPIALYNTFEEVWMLVQHLKEITENKEYEQFSKQRKAIS
jgi:kynureninase